MVSLSLPLHSASKNVKVSLGSAETMAVYSNMIFSGWDFCINQRKAAKVKRKNIFTDIQVDVTAFYDILEAFSVCFIILFTIIASGV